MALEAKSNLALQLVKCEAQSFQHAAVLSIYRSSLPIQNNFTFNFSIRYINLSSRQLFVFSRWSSSSTEAFHELKKIVVKK